MEPVENNARETKNTWVRVENGKIFFSRAAERKFYFYLTLVLILTGLIYKLGAVL